MTLLRHISSFFSMLGQLRTGYAHPGYASSLQEFGRPRRLPRCGGWVLERDIPGTRFRDAVGCYPLFACSDWTRLHEDLEELRDDLVTLTLVPDPLGDPSPDYLKRYFDLVRPFKTHYIADLQRPLESFVGKTHRKNSRKALQTVNVETCMRPLQYADEWIALYDGLIRKHAITGISAFSPRVFRAQLALPGMIMFLAWDAGNPVGATLVLQTEQDAYFHLTACSPQGYRVRAAYALHWTAFMHAREQQLRFFHLGGAAGLSEEPGDGLAEFKRGWSTEQRTAYLCGRIFDRGTYEALSGAAFAEGNYFPAYRAERVQRAGTVVPASLREKNRDEGACESYADLF